MLQIFNSNVGIETVGIREGEKMHETLITREELMRSEDLVDYYRIQYLMKLDYDGYFLIGKENQISDTKNCIVRVLFFLNIRYPIDYILYLEIKIFKN